MPHVRPGTDKGFSTLVVTMADLGSGLEVDLIYVSIHKYNALSRRVVMRNLDCRERTRPSQSNAKVIERISSFTVDFECSVTPFHLCQLSGSWGRGKLFLFLSPVLYTFLIIFLHFLCISCIYRAPICRNQADPWYSKFWILSRCLWTSA